MNNRRLAIETRDLTKSFDEGRIKALQGADLTVQQGEFIAIMGPSGCGKSTLLHLIAALDQPDSGTIRIHGKDIRDYKPLSQYRALEIGIIFQLHNLLPTLNASENVQVPMFESELSAGQRRERAIELLNLTGISGKEKMRPTELSGGERQRVAIARALANSPSIILADEPTGSLDSKAGRQILDLLENMRDQQGLTIVMVTHDPTVAERADRIVNMLDGRVVDEARTQPDRLSLISSDS